LKPSSSNSPALRSPFTFLKRWAPNHGGDGGQGIWELLASICLLTRRYKWAGGVLGTGAMLAAILSHMTWLGYSIQGDHGLLFGMAIISFLGCASVMFMHRHEIPFVTPLSYW
jgi:hypothetical protein